jgi:hypothetical protein
MSDVGTESFATPPLTAEVPSEYPLTLKFTVPEEPPPATDAVRITFWPMVAGFGETEREVELFEGRLRVKETVGEEESLNELDPV